jgi:anaerobic selenocysteine-containing dehydrogenase
MAGAAVAEIHPQTAARLKVSDGAPLSVQTRRGTVRVAAKLTRDIRPDTVFVPFHWPDAQSANRLTIGALDPTSRMPEFKVCAARVDPADSGIAGPNDPSPGWDDPSPGWDDPSPGWNDPSKDTRS